VVGAGGYRPEHAHVAAIGRGDVRADLAGVTAKEPGEGSGAVEAQEPGDLGLASADRGGDLGLCHPVRCGLPHRAHQVGARLRDGVIGSTRDLGAVVLVHSWPRADSREANTHC